jgi:hypothetical protein
VLFTSKNVSNVQPVHEQQPCEHSDFVSTLGVTSILINVNGESASRTIIQTGPLHLLKLSILYCCFNDFLVNVVFLLIPTKVAYFWSKRLYVISEHH